MCIRMCSDYVLRSKVQYDGRYFFGQTKKTMFVVFVVYIFLTTTSSISKRRSKGSNYGFGKFVSARAPLFFI